MASTLQAASDKTLCDCNVTICIGQTGGELYKLEQCEHRPQHLSAVLSAMGRVASISLQGL